MSRWVDADELKTFKSIQSADFNSVETIRQWIDSAPSINVPTRPQSDVIGYRWKLEWILEEAPDVIEALTKRNK